MITIPITYTGLKPTLVENVEIVSGQRETLAVTFSFSEDWNAYTLRTAMFSSRTATRAQMIEEDGTAVIPSEVIRNGERYVKISAFGTLERADGTIERYNGRAVTIRIDIGGEVEESGGCENATAYEKLLVRVVAVEKKLEEFPDTGASIELDTTLTQPGKAADAAAVGDAIAKQNDAIAGKIDKESDPTVPAWAKQPEKPKYTAEEVGAQPAGDYALKNEIPDVPVKSVNGKTGAVSLGASDVGALPAWTQIPVKTSDLQNDSGYITVAVATLLNYYLKSEVYAKGETYSNTEVDNLIAGLSARLNAIADSDDTTLDQLSEIVAYIKENKSLIDSITTSKVNVSDIIDNLTTSVSGKPLSAKQGVELKKLIDAIKIPTSLPASDVYSWAKQPTKPTYTADEVGAASAEEVGRLSEEIADKADKKGWTANKFIGTDASGNLVAKDAPSGGTADSVEILLPSELVAVVGVEFNIYYKSAIRANRTLDNFEIKCALNNTNIGYKLFSECFRLTAVDSEVGDYTLTVQVKDTISGTVKATKSVTLHIVENRSLNPKNVLYIGDSLTFSRGGLYPAEIQYNLSNGALSSIGTQNGTKDSNGIGAVKHEGYNGATVGGFLAATVTSGNTNKFYNPSTGEFDLAYFMNSINESQLDAVCLNLGHNNIGNHVNAVSGLTTIAAKIHEYNADIPVIISLIEPLAGQDGWTAKTKSTAAEMNRHWKNLISAYITAFDNEKISNVYLSTPYLNIDADNDFPTENVARSARDTTQITRQSDAMHPNKVGTLKMADAYYAYLLYRIPEDDAVYYSVTNNLTNVTTNNSAGSIKQGASYSATLTPADGYTFDTVTVTMGGNPVTVTNGIINISAVTGDIIITATAKVYTPSYNNLAKPSTANDASPNTALTADEWLNGYYISSKKISTRADIIVTNKIPLTFNQTIRIKGFTTTGIIGGVNCSAIFRVLPCDASGNALLSEIYPAKAYSDQTTGRLEYMDAAELEKGIYCFSPKNDYAPSYWQNVAFVRICGYPIDGNNANVIVTVDEPIE